MADMGLLMLHGWAVNPRVFVKQREVFSKEYNVFTPDIYGIAGDENGAFSLDKAVDGIAVDVRDSGIKRLFIFGWSFGGIVAVNLYTKLSDITRGIVFCGFSPVFTKSDAYPHGIERSTIRKLRKRIESDPYNAIGEFMKLVMYGYTDSESFELLKNTVFEKIDDTRKDMLLSSLSILEEGDFTEDLKSIKVKSLIIHGTDDRLCSFESVKSMSVLMGDCSLESIKGAPHMPFFTDAAEFNKIMMEFLKNLDKK